MPEALGPALSWAGVPGAMWVGSDWAWVAGLGLGGWLNSWWPGLHWLLSWRHLGVTRSSCRAVALPGTTYVWLWNIQRSPLLQDQTGWWGRSGSQGRGPYPYPSSPSGSNTDGDRAPLNWPWICWSPELSSWWCAGPSWSYCPARWKLW